MITQKELRAAAFKLYDFCNYPAVRYNIESQILDTPGHKGYFDRLHKEFLRSDMVNELYEQ